MIIYRLERESGLGVYTSDGPGRDAERYPFIREYNVYTANHPTPNRDPLLQEVWENCSNRRDYYFGFESLEQLEKWFPPDKHDTFYRWNIRCPYEKISLITFDIDDECVVLGEKQVMFLKAKAKTRTIINSFD